MIPKKENIDLLKSFADMIIERGKIKADSRDLSDAAHRSLGVYLRFHEEKNPNSISSQLGSAASMGSGLELVIEEFSLSQFEGSYAAYRKIQEELVDAGYDADLGHEITEGETRMARLVVSI